MSSNKEFYDGDGVLPSARREVYGETRAELGVSFPGENSFVIFDMEEPSRNIELDIVNNGSFVEFLGKLLYEDRDFRTIKLEDYDSNDLQANQLKPFLDSGELTNYQPAFKEVYEEWLAKTIEDDAVPIECTIDIRGNIRREIEEDYKQLKERWSKEEVTEIFADTYGINPNTVEGWLENRR